MDSKTALEISTGLNTQASDWTPEQQAVIAKHVEAGCTRPQAIRKMKAGTPVAVVASAVVKAAKKSVAKLPKAAKPAAEKKAKRAERDLPESCTDTVKTTREELEDVVRAALKSTYKKVCPILAVLGQRFTQPSQKSGYPFMRFLVDTPDGMQTVFVGGFYAGGPGPKVSMAPAVKSSYTVKAALARIARKTKRAAEALKAEAK